MIQTTERYYIRISGESEGHTEKMLTFDEYWLIKNVLDDCESSYISGIIYKIPDNEYMFNELHLNEIQDLQWDSLKPLITDKILKPRYDEYKVLLEQDLIIGVEYLALNLYSYYQFRTGKRF